MIIQSSPPTGDRKRRRKMLAKRYYDDVSSLKRSLWDPFSVFEDYNRALDSISVDNFYRTEKTETGVNLSIDLPGVKGSDLDVTVEGRTLRVKGIQRGRQISYSYLISKEYDPNTIDASLQDGVLTLSFAKSPELEPKKVTVKVLA